MLSNQYTMTCAFLWQLLVNGQLFLMRSTVKIIIISNCSQDLDAVMSVTDPSIYLDIIIILGVATP